MSVVRVEDILVDAGARGSPGGGWRTTPQVGHVHGIVQLRPLRPEREETRPPTRDVGSVQLGATPVIRWVVLLERRHTGIQQFA